MPKEEPLAKEIQVRLTEENTNAVRRISEEDDRSVPKVVNRIVADAVAKRNGSRPKK